MDAGVGEAAAVEGAKGAGEAAAATDAASIAGDVGVAGAGAGGAEALGAGALGAEVLGGGLAGGEAATALAPGLDAASIAGDVGLSSDAAAALPQVGTGGADIAGGDLAQTSLAPTSGLPPTPGASEFTATTAPVDKGFGQSALDAITKNPLPAAALGVNAASAIAQHRAGGSIPGQLKDIAAPFQKEGQTLLDQYHAGKLNPADEFNINKWEHEAIAAAQGQLGKQGGTALQSKIRDIQAQAQAMRDQALNGLLDSGLKAMGMATGPLTNAVTAQAAQDHEFQAAQSSAMQSFLLLQALQARGS